MSGHSRQRHSVPESARVRRTAPRGVTPGPTENSGERAISASHCVACQSVGRIAPAFESVRVRLSRWSPEHGLACRQRLLRRVGGDIAVRLPAASAAPFYSRRRCAACVDTKCIETTSTRCAQAFSACGESRQHVPSMRTTLFSLQNPPAVTRRSAVNEKRPDLPLLILCARDAGH